MICPTCSSPNPDLHPATQSEGEVLHICEDVFHASNWPEDAIFSYKDVIQVEKLYLDRKEK